MPSRRSWLADQRAHGSLGAAGLVAGVDEAGRGPLAGPVVAAAVILDELAPIKGLKDSKALSPRKRERLFDEIRAKALCCCIAQASAAEIDEINILQATLLAMRDGVAPPTINLHNPDPECDLDYIANEARPLAIENAIANCIAFGSKNSALLLRNVK